MTEFNPPVHSATSLLKASVAAIVIALAVLIAFVLPAEYGIDPTGIGKSLGLTQYSAVSETAEQSNVKSNVVNVSSTPISSSLDKPLTLSPDMLAREETNSGDHSARNDRVDIEIPAGKGLEYKLLLDKHAHLEYEWQTNGSELYFDFHGEPKGDTTGYFESFSITTSSNMKGSLTTPFAGSHGWYWKNRTDKPVIVTLKTKGVYTIKG